MMRLTWNMRSREALSVVLLGLLLTPLLAAENVPMILARDPAGHGLLCSQSGKTVLIVSGTPEQMGAAQGALLKSKILKLNERVLYLVGGADSMQSGVWFLDRMAEIERRTSPHIPKRFLAECDAMAAAVGVSPQECRFANLFPERFHCSGVAVRGKASTDGSVLHARVLDYMRDIRLQDAAVVQVYLPEGRNAWMSLGYAGFLGTVTAMNEKGLAVGEMGGAGDGDWDGVPMSFLLRDIMERASTVEEALAIVRESPRTCEYYYVFSDKARNMAGVHATAKEMIVLRPGEQNPRLPLVPEDTVLISGPGRAETLSQRLQQHYGKIDVPTMIEIIKRPVAMNSNLHNAIFAPETLDMYFADAGKHTVACDEPYARCNLGELIRFHQTVQVQGTGRDGGFTPLFPEDGVPKGWVVRRWDDLRKPADEGVVWTVKQGVLHGSEPRGTWLVSEKEFGDFVLEFEFKLGERGNSGCALRTPMFGDPAFDGMELQMADLRYNPAAKDSELTGGIYRAIAPRKQVYKPTEWNRYQITLAGPRLKVMLNDELIQDVDLDKQVEKVKRHDGSDAPAVKDRPRRGHIGFQELSRGGDHAQIRNARIRVLDKVAGQN